MTIEDLKNTYCVNCKYKEYCESNPTESRAKTCFKRQDGSIRSKAKNFVSNEMTIEKQIEILRETVSKELEIINFLESEVEILSNNRYGPDTCKNCTNHYCRFSLKGTHSECFNHDKFIEEKHNG